MKPTLAGDIPLTSSIEIGQNAASDRILFEVIMFKQRSWNVGHLVFPALALCISIVGYAQEEAPAPPPAVYSGPQAGEVLPPFSMKLGFGERVGSEYDLLAKAGDNPLVVVFVHKRSSPAFGLANAIMKYCKQEGGKNLTFGICFLTADPTETQNWLGNIKNYFPPGTPIGFSPEGIEGPGAYGLNRNVELTVLVANEKKVTANFALVQPGAHVDGPKILAAIADAIGSEETPDINEYLPTNQAAQDAPIAIDPGLMAQIRKLNARDATPESIDESILEIEKIIQDRKAIQRQLGSILARWSRNKRIDAIGNEEQQKKLKQWARQFAPRMEEQSDRQRPNPSDSRLTGLLRSVIQKSNTDEQVDAAAKAVEEYVADNPAATRELARITNTVVNSDKLSNYGTAHCQEVLKAWAKKYSPDRK